MGKYGQIRATLRQLGVRQSSYTLGQAPRDEGYCLIQEDDTYHVFYAERGVRIQERVFSSLNDASEEFLTRIKKDVTVYKDR